ncbi:AtpZ/AtpI family protein [Pseudooceanicola nanhaiensis]|uniref:AtpZ/AtpI family protein n=1 Tax=Pseudooceanicola nanhaiensis TaxID=375761 RepID=UPI001CD3B08D|nr:AtpZ/AtpI family protein [Pseudooceanicola nanhaiensis]MCA0920138.1 AtpZ/AtpI family protein [Pseudooceanicola nanhaiensis]
MTGPAPKPPGANDHLAEAARRTAARDQIAQDTPEPSLGARLGQIGILGWAVIVPTLMGVGLGRMADHYFDTGVFFTAPAIMLGAAIGFRAIWKWMHRQ